MGVLVYTELWVGFHRDFLDADPRAGAQTVASFCAVRH